MYRMSEKEKAIKDNIKKVEGEMAKIDGMASWTTSKLIKLRRGGHCEVPNTTNHKKNWQILKYHVEN